MNTPGLPSPTEGGSGIPKLASAHEVPPPESHPGRPPLPPAAAPEAPGFRPLTESLRRRSIHLTPPQSDALARLLPTRQLVELLALHNGTLAATFQGGGYRSWRAYVTTDGRVIENPDASDPDPTGEVAGPLTIVREPGRLHLGVILPPRGSEQDAQDRQDGQDR